MEYPPAFRDREGAASRLVERFGRAVSHVVNRIAPGRLRADSLIVAHSQTRAALPIGVRGVIYDGISDSGVDMSIWGARGRVDRPSDGGVTRFAYLGRLVDWKGVDLLLEAFRRVADRDGSATLQILGDGPARPALEAQADRLGLRGRVEFVGWVSAREGADRLEKVDVFVLPSLRECGGGVLLEAMALGLPCVATRWGGPGHFVTDETGIRVEPGSPEGFVAGLADAMLRLAESPELRRSMGQAGRRRVAESVYNWDRKVDRVVEIYRETIERHASKALRPEAVATSAGPGR
jgi:glycosyltransferase involved in cell wall biosynthesis